MSVDLSNFNIRKIPETEVARNMKHRNVAYIYFFLEYLTTNDKYKEVFDIDDLKEKNDLIYIKKTPFKRAYETYCIEMGYAWQGVSWSKQVIPLLHNVGCTTRKKSRFNNEIFYDIRFNKQALTNALVNKIVKEDDEE